jgi:hypothetical protein
MEEMHNGKVVFVRLSVRVFHSPHLLKQKKRISINFVTELYIFVIGRI